MLSRYIFFQNRVICGHNIDKNDIFIQINNNSQDYMLHFLCKVCFSIRTGRKILTPPVEHRHIAYELVFVYASDASVPWIQYSKRPFDVYA